MSFEEELGILACAWYANEVLENDLLIPESETLLTLYAKKLIKIDGYEDYFVSITKKGLRYLRNQSFDTLKNNSNVILFCLAMLGEVSWSDPRLLCSESPYLRRYAKDRCMDN